MLHARHALLAGFLLVSGSWSGCGSSADHVELRLFACAIEDMSPRSVILQIQQFDGQGQEMGGVLEETYTVPDGAFDDMFATVHYTPGAGVVTADFTVYWFASELAGTPDQADVTQSFPGEVVPAKGKHLSLDGMCPDGGSGSGTTTGVSGTGGGPGTGAATGSSTGGTTTAATSSSTTDGTGSTSGTSGSTGGSTGGGTGGMNGMSCGGQDQFYCEVMDADGKGTLLECVGGTWMPATLNLTCTFCDVGETPIGCATEGVEWACLCQALSPPACTQAANMCDAGTLTLCVDGEVATADCVNTCMYTDPGDYTCN